MSSIRMRVVDAVIEALEAASASGTTKPAGLVVRRGRVKANEQASLPLIGVYLLGEANDFGEDSYHVNRPTRTLDMAFECETTVNVGESPDEALDPLYVWAVKAMHADYTLGGIASNVVEGNAEWATEVQDEEFAQLILGFRVIYVTTEIDPESQA